MWQGAAVAGAIKLIKDTAEAGIELKKGKNKGAALAQIIGQAVIPGIGGPIAKAIGNIVNKKNVGSSVSSLVLESIGSGLSVAKDIISDPILKKKMAERKAKREAKKIADAKLKGTGTMVGATPEAEELRAQGEPTPEQLEAVKEGDYTPVEQPMSDDAEYKKQWTTNRLRN